MSRRAEMAERIGALLDGVLSGDAALEFLQSLPLESLTPDMLAGAVDAVMARRVAFPSFPDAVDCCGTGGDGLSTYNISTTVAFVLAGGGVRVAKHGNRAVSSASGSADVLQALGARIDMPITRCAALLEETGICFLFAPQFHPGFARVAPLRKAIGARTIFNLLGPLCNPAGVERQVIGVFARQLCPLMAEAAQLLGRECVIVVHGAHGEDELSVMGESFLAALHAGSVAEGSFFPHDVGLDVAHGQALLGGDAATNAAALCGVLDGTAGAYADAVALNAAAGFIAAGKAETFTDGIALAREVIHTGRAREALQRFITASNAYV